MPESATAAAAAATAAAEQRKVEIATALARCTALLKTISAVTITKDPIEEGACGALAPVELVSIGKNPEVAISPPAILNCDMVVALHNWIKSDVQPLARKHLGSAVVRIETMSSYSCRNAYGRKLSRLSEHGKANALDIRGVVTAKGEAAHVLADWGLTSSEIRTAVSKAEKEQAEREVAAAAAKADAETKARAIAAAKTGPSNARQPGASPIESATTLVEGLPKGTLSVGIGAGSKSSDLGLAQPSHLGGPKKKAEKAAEVPPPPTSAPNQAPQALTVASDGTVNPARSLFLREMHASACRRFATTLGPESNASHRNHFHVDLADRKSKAICE